VWGALIPFIGPYFHYAFGSYGTWHFTTNRLWLDIIPGAAAVIGGFLLLTSSHRSSGLLGGWLALAAGVWFGIGPVVSLLWHSQGAPIGAPQGGHIRQMVELLGYFYGLGLLIATLAAFSMGRFVSRPPIVEEPAVVTGPATAEAAREDRVSRDRVPATDGTAGGNGTTAGEGTTAADRTTPAEPAAERTTSADRTTAT
jgi:hypothetical protein